MFKYPWGNLQALNLAWFLDKFKQLREDWATAEVDIENTMEAEIQRAEDALSDVFDARDAAAASATAAETSETNAEASAATAAQIIAPPLQTPDFGANFSLVAGKYVIMGNVCSITARIKCITPTRWFGALPHAIAAVPAILIDLTNAPTTVTGYMAAYNGEITLTSTEAAKLVANHEYDISLTYIIEQ